MLASAAHVRQFLDSLGTNVENFLRNANADGIFSYRRLEHEAKLITPTWVGFRLDMLTGTLENFGFRRRSRPLRSIRASIDRPAQGGVKREGARLASPASIRTLPSSIASSANGEVSRGQARGRAPNITVRDQRKLVATRPARIAGAIGRTVAEKPLCLATAPGGKEVAIVLTGSVLLRLCLKPDLPTAVSNRTMRAIKACLNLASQTSL